MYYVKFTIKDLSTKERKIKESPLLENYDIASKIVANYLENTKNVINIKSLGCGKYKVLKNGGEIKIEILER
jgi:hypothetical protein